MPKKKRTTKKPRRARATGIDPTKLLKADHEKLRALFTESEALSDRATRKRRELYMQIKLQLQIHTKVEEDIFYPALGRLRTKESKKLELQAREEHAVVKIMLGEIDRAGNRDAAFPAKLKVLRDIVLHHVEEEEAEIFPMIRRSLGKPKLEIVGAQILGLRQQLMMRGGKDLVQELAST